MILHGYGRLAWPAALRLLDGCACTWTDLDGIHVTDTPPAELPVGATHLWGWTDAGTDRWVRVRFDHDAVYAAVLRPDEDGADVVLTRDPVDVSAPKRARLWGENDRRVGELPPDVTALAWELTEVPGPNPVTFVRAAPAS